MFHVFLVMLFFQLSVPYQYPCIPVLGFGVIMDSQNFVERLARSIDHCVDNVVIVMPDAHSASHLPPTARITSWFNTSFVHRITFAHKSRPLIGVAEGWNMILTSFDAPWYLISAYDVQFIPGNLSRLADRFWRESGILTSQNYSVNFAHTKWVNMPGGRGFNLFALNQDVLKYCGMFDENIFPAFWEDTDYRIRLQRWDGAKVKTFGGIRMFHGSSSDTTYVSSTKFLDERFRRVMSAAGKSNVDYLVDKWGCDYEMSVKNYTLVDCKYKWPFNGKYGEDLGVWKLNIKRRKHLLSLYH